MCSRFILTLISCAGIVSSAHICHAQTASYDLVIKNGRIVDGSGNPWYRAEIAIQGDTITEIASRIDAPAKRIFDAKDNVVAPGFIDVHTHSRRNLLRIPTADN